MDSAKVTGVVTTIISMVIVTFIGIFIISSLGTTGDFTENSSAYNNSQATSAVITVWTGFMGLVVTILVVNLILSILGIKLFNRRENE